MLKLLRAEQEQEQEIYLNIKLNWWTELEGLCVVTYIFHQISCLGLSNVVII